MRPPPVRIHHDDLIVDNFAGGGGASTGIEWAFGRSPDIAINHDAEAIAVHAANHPATRHYCEDVWKVDPKEACRGKRVALAWFSPDCKHFSKAKGGKPVEKKIRGLAWVVTRWAKAVRPRVIILENVEEFQDWGPLLDDNKPCPVRRGLTFRRWLGVLRNCGYVVEHRELRACDYGAPTSRKRLFVIARSDGLPIVWPQPTHGPGRLPYRTAAECLDFGLPCPSIFERKRPLAENTLRRIGRGVRRYVIENASPFIIPLTHHWNGGEYQVDEPMRTVTAAHRGEHALVTPFVARTDMHLSNAGCVYPPEEPLRTMTTAGGFGLVTPYLAGVGGRMGQSPERSVDRPYHTATAKADTALVAPTLIQQSWGERKGQAPRIADIEAPLGTVVGGGIKHAMVAAFLARHYGGHENDGAQPTLPFFTVTAKDHHALVASHLLKLRGDLKDHPNTSQDLKAPVPTLTASGTHLAEVRAFLVKYYGTEQDPQLGLPLHTVTTKDRFGLVTVQGHDYAIADIGMRMLVPRELFNAQGFRPGYLIEIPFHGKQLSKTAQVRLAGNSVCPDLAEALVRANFAAREAEVAA